MIEDFVTSFEVKAGWAINFTFPDQLKAAAVAQQKTKDFTKQNLFHVSGVIISSETLFEVLGVVGQMLADEGGNEKVAVIVALAKLVDERDLSLGGCLSEVVR